VAVALHYAASLVRRGLTKLRHRLHHPPSV
jgi:hypothetical protein